MKIKIFYDAYNLVRLEEKINQWIKEHEDCIVVDTKQTATDDFILFTILYEEK